MAKQGGMGDNLYVAGFDLSGDIGSLEAIGGGPAALQVTGIDKSAHERIGGLRDGRLDYTSFFNDAVGQSHPVHSALPTADVTLTYCRGTTIGNAAACCVAKSVNYPGTRPTDGSFTFKLTAQANAYGIEWGRQLTAGKRTDTTATSPATGVDHTTVSTSLGWQAYLQVFAFTGTSVTVTLQDSADNSSFASFTGSAFTAATGVTTQRLAGASNATVRRYIRAITTGTFSNAVFNVVFMRNDTSVVF